MLPKPINANAVDAVPSRIILRGLNRCTSNGPTHKVSVAAKGKPNVTSERDHPKAFM
jgi:hypothetical protein